MQYLEVNKMSKSIEIAYLTKIEKGNLNADSTKGNITILKKTQEINGDERVYISGESVKYSIKEYLKDENGVELSPIKERTEESQVTTECDPENYIDDDLFGYMDTQEDLQRTAPVKTNGLISIFPWKSDINQGVRFSEEGEQHSMHNLEITTSVMRGNFLISLDRIGKWDGGEISDKDKNKRLKKLIKSIFNLWGGANQTNYLTDIKPQAIVIAERGDKAITIGDKLKIDEDYNLDIDSLLEALHYSSEELNQVYFSSFSSFLNNLNEVKEKLETVDDIDVSIESMGELKNNMIEQNYYGK